MIISATKLHSSGQSSRMESRTRTRICRVRLIPLNAGSYEQHIFQPRLRDDILLGPPQHKGAAIVYHLKDRFTNCFYRVGVKEYFLISRMDGSRSLQELNDAYTAEFGRSLNERSWAGLFALLEKRQWLANTAESPKLEDLKREVVKRKREENSGLLRRRFPLIQPDAFLEKLLPWFQFMFRRAFVLPMLVSIVILEIFVFLHLTPLIAEAWMARRSIWNYVFFLMLSWVLTIIHEIAHGLTCKKFGGSVSEMGLLWRYLTIFPYCKIDDVVLFHNRWHRVYTSFAGIFVNFLSVIPFCLLWIFTPAHSMLHTISVLMLLSFNLTIFVNFIPFIELDGYFMLNHALDMVDLRRESHQFWLRGILKTVLKRSNGNAGFSRRDASIYLIYGFFSLVVTGVLFVALAFCWFLLIKYWLGNIVAWGLVLLVILVFLYRELGKRKIICMPHLLQYLLKV